MAERTEREVLHHLVEICKDGERGFRAAAEYVEEPALKTLFMELAEQRARFASALEPHLHRLGGRTDWEGTNAGALHRGWMSLMGHLPGHGDDAIVSEAERGEHFALGAYEEALNGMLPPTVVDLVEEQREALRKAHERLRVREQVA
jgi:uncharacterized protein (TIGR02284 family)